MSLTVEEIVIEMLILYGVQFADRHSMEVSAGAWAKQIREAVALEQFGSMASAEYPDKAALIPIEESAENASIDPIQQEKP